MIENSREQRTTGDDAVSEDECHDEPVNQVDQKELLKSHDYVEKVKKRKYEGVHPHVVFVQLQKDSPEEEFFGKWRDERHGDHHSEPVHERRKSRSTVFHEKHVHEEKHKKPMKIGKAHSERWCISKRCTRRYSTSQPEQGLKEDGPLKASYLEKVYREHEQQVYRKCDDRVQKIHLFTSQQSGYHDGFYCVFSVFRFVPHSALFSFYHLVGHFLSLHSG